MCTTEELKESVDSQMQSIDALKTSVDYLSQKIKELTKRVYDNWEQQEAFARESRADRANLRERTSVLERSQMTEERYRDILAVELGRHDYLTESGILAAIGRGIARSGKRAAAKYGAAFVLGGSVIAAYSRWLHLFQWLITKMGG